MLYYPDMHVHIASSAELDLHEQISTVFLNATSSVDFAAIDSSLSDKRVYPFFGIHPWFVKDESESGGRLMDLLRIKLEGGPECGIGECGLDFSGRHKDSFGIQLTFFEKQLSLAYDLMLPLSVHCVRAWGPMIKILKRYSPLPRPFILHSFYGSVEVMRQLVDLGAFISLSSLSVRNPQRSAPVIQCIPPNRLLAETDLMIGGTDFSAQNHFNILRNNYKTVSEIRSVTETELLSGVIENGKVFTN